MVCAVMGARERAEEGTAGPGQCGSESAVFRGPKMGWPGFLVLQRAGYQFSLHERRD